MNVALILNLNREPEIADPMSFIQTGKQVNTADISFPTVDLLAFFSLFWPKTAIFDHFQLKRFGESLENKETFWTFYGHLNRVWRKHESRSCCVSNAEEA